MLSANHSPRRRARKETPATRLTDHFFHRHRATVFLGQQARVHFSVNGFVEAGVDLDAFSNFLGDQGKAEIESEFHGRMGVNSVNLLVSHRYGPLKSSSLIMLG